MKTPRDDRFRTHISEPRWQQVLSVIIVLFFVGLWVWAALFSDSK